MTKNERLYDAALNAVTTLFSDRSVSKAETRERLQELAVEIEVMLDSLEEGDGG